MKLNYIRRLFKIIGILLLTFIFLFIIALVLLQQPKVQTYITNKVLDRIESNNSADASIEKVNLKLPKSLVIKGFYQSDENGDTLIYADKLITKLNLFQPFKKQIYIKNLKLDGAKIYLKRNEGEEDFNFNFLIKENKDALKTTNKKDDNPFDIKIKDFELNNTHFKFIDEGKVAIHSAYLKQLKVNIKSMDIAKQDIHIDKILIDGPNIIYETLSELEKKEKKLTELIPNLGWQIKVNEVEFKDGNFQAINKFTKQSSMPINLADLNLNDINTSIKDISYDSTLQLTIEDFTFNDGNQIRLKRLKGKVTVSQNSIVTENLKIALNNSNLSATSNIKIRDFENIMNGSFQSSFINAYLTPSDANLFLPQENRISKPISINLRSRGNLNNLSIQRLNLKADDLKLLTKGTIKNISNPKQAKFNLQIVEILGSSQSIKSVVPWLELPEQITSLGNVSGTGIIKGSTDNVFADLNIQSDAGNLVTSVSLDMRGEELVYNGDITIPSFNIQQVLPGAPLGRAGGTFRIDGSGTSFETIDGKVQGKLDLLELQGYSYRDIFFNGEISDKVFNGNINIDDENIAFNFDGMLDLSDSIPAINSKMKVDHIDLQALKLMDKPFTVGLEGDIEFVGNDFNTLNGALNLSSLHLKNEKNEINLDSTLFTFKSVEGIKSYDIINDKLKAHAEGAFDPILWPNEIKRYLSNYIYYLNDTDTTAITEQQIKGSIVLEEGFGLVDFFVGTIGIPENLEGEFEFHNTEDIFNIKAHSNLISYNKFDANYFNFAAETKDGELLTSTGIDMLSAQKPNLDINHLDLSTITTKNSIDGRFTVESEESANGFDLSPSILFADDSISIKFKDSYFKLNKVLWPFNPANQIVLKEGSMKAKDFAIFNDNQYLQIVNASSDLSEALIEFNMLSLPSFANIIKLDTIITNGFLTGQVKLTDPLKDLSVNADLVFSSLNVFDFYCDSISIDAKYNKGDNMVNLAAIFDDPNYDLSAVGHYDLKKGVSDPVLLDLNVNRLSLSFLDLILKDEAQFDLFGEGKLQFKGSFTEPVLLGEAYVIDTGKVHIDFLGIDLLIFPENGLREKVIFTENTMDFQSVNVRDPFGNRAYMEGKLTHFNFKDMSVNAKLFTDNFNMLNTTFNDNEQFFGRAFGEGSVFFSGLTNNINMDIDMKTKPFTKLSIPLASAGDTKDYNFVFINPNADSNTIDIKEPLIEIKGINMDFNLEITPDAELELVLNTDSENNMRAQGQGNLNLRIDQNKQLSIYGTYNLIDGDYVFSPQNLLNKEFKIENGSKIHWNGKPFEAGLDVDATYYVNARVDNILEDSSQSSQIVPMDVIIHIGGTLNETDVSFDIKPARTSIASSIDEVESFLDEIKNDQGEITTQAIALLLVGRFLPSNSTVFSSSSFSASEFGKTTALELVSNQVSNYLTDAISKLITEVELSFNIIQREDYSLEEPGQTTTVQLDYTQKFVNNRLIVNIGGNFEFVDENNEQGNTIAGDFEVEGLLTEDGRLRGKAFHRTADYDIFNQDRSKTGVSLSYQKDFDTIDEVFKPDPIKKKRRERKRQTKRDDRKERRKQKTELKKADAIKEDSP